MRITDSNALATNYGANLETLEATDKVNRRASESGSLQGLRVTSAANSADTPASLTAKSKKTTTTTANSVPTTANSLNNNDLLRLGSQGAAVAQVQRQLTAVGLYRGNIDGVFGTQTEAALKTFQRRQGLAAHGILGYKTRTALAQSANLPTKILRQGDQGDDVVALQRVLATKNYPPGALDGNFGAKTTQALSDFQRHNGLVVDGIYGAQTRATLLGLKSAINTAQVTSNEGIEYNGKTVSDTTLRKKLQELSGFLGHKINITSGDRQYVPPGGSRTSLHLARRAVDFHVTGLTDADVFNRLRTSGLINTDYEVIHHGKYTQTSGPHLHLGRYGDGRPSQFKVEGLLPETRGRYLRLP
jgi:peptidoglycan hydrolase-like protein with peptidoglycan-binding domain